MKLNITNIDASQCHQRRHQQPAGKKQPFSLYSEEMEEWENHRDDAEICPFCAGTSAAARRAARMMFRRKMGILKLKNKIIV
ncbi:hypothetical protein [Neisseria dentiae]|uniref:hypothetical protein n=1 Tax=Neisseria dentiae TaxID=194197 RepID=UPI0035A0670F